MKIRRFNSLANIHRRDRGTSVMEFVLIMPAMVMAMLLLIGMGRTLVLRQHALAAARYSAFYQKIHGALPPGNVISKEVSMNPEPWRVSAQEEDAGQTFTSHLEQAVGEVVDFFGSLVSQKGRSGSIDVRAAHDSNSDAGFRMLEAGSVSAHYALPTGTWTSSCCGAFMPLLLKDVQLFGLGPNASSCSP